MIGAGVGVPSFEQAFHRLKEIDLISANGKETFRRFLQEIKANPKLEKVATAAYYGKAENDIDIRPLEGAIEILTVLAQNHSLVLLSRGVEEEQHRKLAKAGIPTTFFRSVIITNDYDKENHYKNILKQLKFAPTETVAVGDKMETDLIPAKKLKMHTIHMRWGRGKIARSSEQADYTITSLRQLPPIVEKLTR